MTTKKDELLIEIERLKKQSVSIFFHRLIQKEDVPNWYIHFIKLLLFKVIIFFIIP